MGCRRMDCALSFECLERDGHRIVQEELVEILDLCVSMVTDFDDAMASVY